MAADPRTLAERAGPDPFIHQPAPQGKGLRPLPRTPSPARLRPFVDRSTLAAMSELREPPRRAIATAAFILTVVLASEASRLLPGKWWYWYLPVFIVLFPVLAGVLGGLWGVLFDRRHPMAVRAEGVCKAMWFTYRKHREVRGITDDAELAEIALDTRRRTPSFGLCRHFEEAIERLRAVDGPLVSLPQACLWVVLAEGGVAAEADVRVASAAIKERLASLGYTPAASSSTQ